MDANPYQSPRESCSGNLSPDQKLIRSLSKSAVLGVVCGLVLFEVISLIGYRGIPTYIFYLYGPTIWLGQIGLEDEAFILTCRVAMSAVWIAYWSILLWPELKIRHVVRLVSITVFHTLSVAIYQIVYGFH